MLATYIKTFTWRLMLHACRRLHEVLLRGAAHVAFPLSVVLQHEAVLVQGTLRGMKRRRRGPKITFTSKLRVNILKVCVTEVNQRTTTDENIIFLMGPVEKEEEG